MTDDRPEHYLGLLRELVHLPRECEWVEFKINNSAPDQIGEHISALANTAALFGKDHGYLVWGVEDGSHRVLGTRFQPHTTRQGNEELEN